MCEIILTIKEDKMAEEIKDTTKEDVTDKDGDKSSPIDKGEFEKAKGSAEALSSLLEDHGFDSIEDLKTEMSDGKELKDLLGDADANEILAKAKTLDSYEKHWAKEEEKAKYEEEDTDDKVARLEKELNFLKKSKIDEEARKGVLQDNQKALNTFNTEVKNLVENNEAIPEEYRLFVAEFLGVDNPANEIDITKPAEIRKMHKQQTKKVQDWEQAVIKRYRDGKSEVPVMTKTEPLDVEQVKEKQPQTSAEAKKMATEILTNQFFG